MGENHRKNPAENPLKNKAKKFLRKNDEFYHTKEWRKLRLLALKRDNYLCKSCWRIKELTVANTVHHIQTIDDRPDLALALSNLESICPSCHNKERKEEITVSNKIKVVVETGNREFI